jgi:uncharacterized protein YecT (DUF1311 family)
MHITGSIVAAVALVLAADIARAGECASASTQDEKIACLERSIQALERRLHAERLDVDRRIDEKLRQALEPRVWEVAPQ